MTNIFSTMLNKLFPTYVKFIIPNEKGALMNFNTLLYDFKVKIVDVAPIKTDKMGEWYKCTGKAKYEDAAFLKSSLTKVFALKQLSDRSILLLPKKHYINKENSND